MRRGEDQFLREGGSENIVGGVMTPAELRAAAWYELQQTEREINDGHPALIQLAKRAEVFRHVLATVREDDGEPVTEEWAVAIGFRREVDPHRGVRDMFHVAGLVWRPHFCEDCHGRWQYGPMTIKTHPKTRGQLRALLAALGIEVKG